MLQASLPSRQGLPVLSRSRAPRATLPLLGWLAASAGGRVQGHEHLNGATRLAASLR